MASLTNVQTPFRFKGEWGGTNGNSAISATPGDPLQFPYIPCVSSIAHGEMGGSRSLGD